MSSPALEDITTPITENLAQGAADLRFEDIDADSLAVAKQCLIDWFAVTLAGAHATIAIPFVVLIVGAAHRQLDPTFEKAARVLGAGPVRAFFSAAFPSLLPGIIAAFVFSFFVSFDELIISEFMMSEQETLPMRIWADLRLELRPTIAAVSSLLIVVTTLGMGLAEIFRRRSVSISNN